MEEIQAKLAAYRAKRVQRIPKPETEPMLQPEETPISVDDSPIEKSIFGPVVRWAADHPRTFRAITLTAKLTTWLVFLTLAVELEFTAVYVLLTLFYLIWANLASGKKAGELSAYSVFNPGCERLPGTLTAEHFEREMRFGPGASASVG